MTIVLETDYHERRALEDRRIVCVSKEEAAKQDIRALRIGILNVMPKAETYEFSLLYPLGRSVLQIEPIWIRLNCHEYLSSDQKHLDSHYLSFEEAVREKHLDGLIITGAPVEEMPFEQVEYWDEIVKITKYARTDIASTLGICWGGLALAKVLGIEKTNYDMKLFGAYETENLNKAHLITGELDDVFLCPQSRHAGIEDDVMELESEKGTVNLLAYNEDAGYTIFESTDGRYIMHLGHPEYETHRLMEEYNRDKKLKRTDVPEPKNFDVKRPMNRWRSHRTEFFTQWLKYVYEKTPY